MQLKKTIISHKKKNLNKLLFSKNLSTYNDKSKYVLHYGIAAFNEQGKRTFCNKKNEYKLSHYVYRIKEQILINVFSANYLVEFRLPEIFDIESPDSFQKKIQLFQQELLTNYSNTTEIYWTIHFPDIMERIKLGNRYNLTGIKYNLLIKTQNRLLINAENDNWLNILKKHNVNIDFNQHLVLIKELDIQESKEICRDINKQEMLISAFKLYQKKNSGLENTYFDLWKESERLTLQLIKEIAKVEENCWHESLYTQKLSKTSEFFANLRKIKETINYLPNQIPRETALLAFNKTMKKLTTWFTNYKALKEVLTSEKEIKVIQTFCSSLKSLDETFFNSIDELFLENVIRNFSEKKTISRYSLMLEFGKDIFSIYCSLINIKEFPKLGFEEYIPFLQEVNNENRTLEFAARTIVKNNPNLTLVNLGKPLFEFFRDYYSHAIELIQLNLGGNNEDHVYFALRTKLDNKQNAKGALLHLTKPLVATELLSEIEKASLAATVIDLVIAPPIKWEKGKSGKDNFTGIFKENKKLKLQSLISPHWVNEHDIEFESDTLIEVINWLQETPYLINENAFNFYFSEKNSAFITKAMFEERLEIQGKLQHAFNFLKGDKISQDRLKVGILENQKIISSYYDQTHYFNAIENARSRFRKASKVVYDEEKKTNNLFEHFSNLDSIFPISICAYYFATGIDYRTRLTSKQAASYLNSSYFRLLFTSIYKLENNLDVLKEALTARITGTLDTCKTEQDYKERAKKGIEIYSLLSSINSPLKPTFEVINADAVSSGVQHCMLFLQNGRFAKELYFTSEKGSGIYTVLGDAVWKYLLQLHNDHINSDIKDTIEKIDIKEKFAKYKGEEAHFIVPTKKTYLAKIRLMLQKNGKFNKVFGEFLTYNMAATLLTELFDISQDTDIVRLVDIPIKTKIIWKAIIMPVMYGSGIYGLERHLKDKLAKKGVTFEREEVLYVLAGLALHFLDEHTDFLTLRNILFKINAFACKNKIELKVPGVFNYVITPKYRTMKVKRIARRVILASTMRSHKHRIQLPFAKKEVDFASTLRGFVPNIIQGNDANVLLITSFLIKQRMNPDFPFFGMWVHDSISLHSSLLDFVISLFRQVHKDLYKDSINNLPENPSWLVQGKPLLDNLLADLFSQISSFPDFDILKLQISHDLEHLDPKFKLDWDLFSKEANLLKVG